MFTLSSKSDYALVLLAYLAKNSNDKPVSLRKIAESQNLPLKYLSSIATQLSKAKIIISKEGVTGGIMLVKSPQDISVREILEVFEGQIAATKCTHSPGSCPSESVCNLKPVWAEIQKQLIATVQEKTLAELVGIKLSQGYKPLQNAKRLKSNASVLI